MGRKKDFATKAGKRLFFSLEEYERINAGMAQRIAEETRTVFVPLVQRDEYALAKPVRYFQDLMAEHTLLREQILKLPGGKGEEILRAMDVANPLPGHELFVAPYCSQLKMRNGRQQSAGGLHMDPHHVLMTWKGLEYRQQGLIHGFSRQKGATILIPEDMHLRIHQKNPRLYRDPYDSLQADLDRFSEVAIHYGYSPEAIEATRARVIRINENFGIQPRSLRAAEAPAEDWGARVAKESKSSPKAFKKP